MFVLKILKSKLKIYLFDISQISKCEQKKYTEEFL